MSIKKPLIVAGLVATLGVAGVSSLGVASATTDSSDSGASRLVAKIAEKFHLKQSDVQAVFDEDRAARETERQQKVEDRLTQAVKDGKITEEQKTKILAKLAELKTHMDANRDALKDKTAEERRAAMKQQREELQKWAEDNDIPLRYLMFMGRPGHHGPGPGMEEPPADASPQS